MARRHKLHPSHARSGEPPLLRRKYQHEFGNWSCEACLRVRPANDPSHTYDEGCKSAGGGFEVARRRGKGSGEPPVRDPVVPVGGAADIKPIADDDSGLDVNVSFVYDMALQEEDALGILRGSGRIVTNDEEGGDIAVHPSNQNKHPSDDVINVIRLEQDDDGYIDPVSPVSAREQRVAKARNTL